MSAPVSFWAVLNGRATGKMPVTKIVSGGQTGADQGGLLAAQDLGIRTGGHAPRGFRTEAGQDLALKSLGLVESGSGYARRTRLNAEDSDATVIIAADPDSPGSRLTAACCSELGRPCLVVRPDAEGRDVRKLRAFLRRHTPGVLNVAGNRESKAPGICDETRRIVACALGQPIVGVSGNCPGAGKSTAARVFAQHLRCKVWAVADPLYECAATLTGLPQSRLRSREGKRSTLDQLGGMTVGQFLQRLGTDAVRERVHPNVWVSVLERRIRAAAPGASVVVGDVRFPNEARLIRRLGGIIARVERKAPDLGDGRDLGHPSETSLDGDVPDFVFVNDGSLSDLEEEVGRVAERLAEKASAPAYA